MAQLFNTNGYVKEVSPANGRVFTFQEFYRLIGCQYVEQLRLGDGTVLTFDEEGKLTDKEINSKASYLVKDILFWGDYIAGAAVLSTEKEAGFMDEEE
jgi:hypothetical protein